MRKRNQKNHRPPPQIDAPEKKNRNPTEIAMREGKTHKSQTKNKKKAPNTPHNLPRRLGKGKGEGKKRKKETDRDGKKSEGVCLYKTQQRLAISRVVDAPKKDRTIASLIPDGAGMRM